MKKIALFAAGAVVGYFTCIALEMIGESCMDTVLYEDDKMVIKQSTEPTDSGIAIAMVHYK